MCSDLANLTRVTTTEPTASFKRQPTVQVRQVPDPVATVVDHLGATCGQFDRLSWRSDPAQITATDILAVSMIAQPVPPAAAAWLLSDQGQWLSAEILADIAPDATLQSCTPQSILRIADLFHLIRRPSSQLPGRKRARSLSQACATRLLAAKRPGLVPIDDRTIRRALGYKKDEVWWQRWKLVLDSDATDLIGDIRATAAQQEPAANRLSDLRIFDIVIRS